MGGSVSCFSRSSEQQPKSSVGESHPAGSKSSEPSGQQEPRQMNFGLASVFRYEELKQATNNFDSSKVLGGGGYGRVYLGTLGDGRKVAVKKLYDDNESILEQFFNEVTVLSRVRHQNLVTLHGCSNPQTRELLLVYEYVPNGTVADHLHCGRSALSWGARLLIAIETVEALEYLHSQKPAIIHRDVKSSNILLDDNFHAKVADLGICRLLPWDTTSVSTAPQGTVGYRDPEYEQYYNLTDKSDVYSLGVVLLELLSGKQVVDVHRHREEIYLVPMALDRIVNKELDKLVDPTLGYDSDCEIRRMIDAVTKLACSCLRTKGTMRPSMMQVLTILKGIRDATYDDGVREPEELETYMFSHKELHEAANSFDPSQELGNGISDKVYNGKLRDGRMVTMKVLQVVLTCSNLPELSDISTEDATMTDHLQRMLDEVIVVSCLRHKNLLTLYGMTRPVSRRETLLVYEYVPYNTLENHLHHQRLPLSWASRVQIAIETAEALAFIHSHNPSIVHSCLKTSNILLDSAFNVKVADIGMWPLLDDPAITMGYRDPEYYFAYSLSSNHDVYSFGVVLVELVSGNQPKKVNLNYDEFRLVTEMLSMIINNELEMLVDPKLEYHSDSEVKRMVDSVAKLAFRCLNRVAKMRPSMAEVLASLKAIKDGTLQKLELVEINVFGCLTDEPTIFSHEELEEATDSFDRLRELYYHPGLYIGNLRGQAVTVHVLSNIDSNRYPEWTEQLFEEVKVVSHLRHEHLVILYGCTNPRRKKLFLVYEYLANRSIAAQLHSTRLTLGWPLRIQIAMETAEALSYLHSLEPPIVHNGVTTYNILLDENFHVKVAVSSLFMRWTTEAGVGTNGYIDPEHKNSKRTTVKSDVYSFGVVLFELITGWYPFYEDSRFEDQHLADICLKLIRDNKRIVQSTLDYDSNPKTKRMINAVVDLACMCLLPEGNLRPSMMQVLSTLKKIHLDGNTYETK